MGVEETALGLVEFTESRSSLALKNNLNGLSFKTLLDLFGEL